MSDPRNFFKPGAVVYFKKCLRRPTSKSDGISSKGYAFGVLLGVVPPFAPDPTPEHCFRLMGTAGYISFDDVIEILGEEKAGELLEKFTKKYYASEAQETDAPPPSNLLGPDGKPIARSAKILSLPQKESQ